MKGPIWRNIDTNEYTTEEPQRGELVVRAGDNAPVYILELLPKSDLTKTDKAAVKEAAEGE